MTPPHYEGKERRERDCCDDCSRQCGEHELRGKTVDALQKEVDDMWDGIVKRRDIIDEEISKIKEAQGTMRILGWAMFAGLVVLISLAKIGEDKGDAVGAELRDHIESVASEKGKFKAHLEAASKQEDQMRILCDNSIRTQQILENIDKRLCKIEEKVH